VERVFSELASEPRIVAVSDVRMSALPRAVADLRAFYNEMIGLEFLQDDSSGNLLAFRGHQKTGPRLLIQLASTSRSTRLRRQLLLETKSLAALAESAQDRRVVCMWSHGWTYYDRRLIMLDPAGNRVEVVSRHTW